MQKLSNFTDDEMIEQYGIPKEVKQKQPVNSITTHYKLGEVINNGIKYWGQDKLNKHSNRTSMVICGCGTAWRVQLHNVITGNTTSCGCRNKIAD